MSVSLENSSGLSVTAVWYSDGRKVGEGLSYIPGEEDLETILSVSVTAVDGEGKSSEYTTSLYFSKLPVVSVTTENSAITGTYSQGTAVFYGSADYPYASETLYAGELSIKLRGNSTKGRPKSSYKIKLESKADLYGMGANKHWVLLGNDIDHTQIRNILVQDFAGALGMEYMDSIPVTLFLNGEYAGIYQLSEQIRVGTTRVDIFDWDELAEDGAEAIVGEEHNLGQAEKLSGELKTEASELEDALQADYSWITQPYSFSYSGKTYTMTDYVDIPNANGGFILEMDFYHLSYTDANQITTAFSQPYYFSKPETLSTNSIMREYAARYIQTFEYALHSDDFVFRNSDVFYRGSSAGWFDWEQGWPKKSVETEYQDEENDGKHYTELFDLDSLIQNFFVCEFSMNWDSMKNSTFITKDVDELAKMSPVWDFDWAFGNNNMYSIWTWEPESWQTTNEYFTNEQYYQSVQWNRYLIKDPYFLLQLYLRYDDVSKMMHEITEDGGTIDQYIELLSEAARRNDDLWGYSYGSYGGEYYSEATESLRNFISIRTNWLDAQFADFETLRLSLGYYETSDQLKVTDASWRENAGEQEVELTAAVSDESMVKISFQVNGTWFGTAQVEDGKAVITVPAEALVQEGENMVQIRGMDNEGNYIKPTGATQDPDSVDPYSNYMIF